MANPEGLVYASDGKPVAFYDTVVNTTEKHCRVDFILGAALTVVGVMLGVAVSTMKH